MYHLSIWGPFLLVTAGLVGIIIYGYARPNHPKSNFYKEVGVLCIIIWFFLYAMTLPSRIKAPGKAMEAEVKANLHAIQVALERYGTDHPKDEVVPGEAVIPAHFALYYPSDINELIGDYLTEFPDNPFVKDGRMKNVEFKDGPSEGNFTYVPFNDENGDTVGYYLMAYGYISDKPGGLDVNVDGTPDEAILVLTSAQDFETMAPLPDLLNEKKVPAE